MNADEEIARVHAVLRTALMGWLSGLAAGGAHWQTNPTPPNDEAYTLPFVVAQLPRPGTLRRYMGGAAVWAGDVTIRAVAADQSGAEALLRTAAAAVPASAGPLTDPGGGAGWDASTRALASPVSPPATRTQAVASMAYRLELTRRAA